MLRGHVLDRVIHVTAGHDHAGALQREAERAVVGLVRFQKDFNCIRVRDLIGDQRGVARAE